MKRLKSLLPGLVLALLFPLGCSEYGNELQYVQEGSIHVKITDAPFPADMVESANITIVKIEARRTEAMEEDSMEESSMDEGESEESPYVTLFEGEETINISELNNGITQSMGVSNVPVGTYDLFRVYITESSLTLKDERTFDVKVPSGSQSGLKIFVKPSIVVEGDEISEVLLDMDLSKSFVLRGNPKNIDGINGFIFKPVIRAMNMGYAGIISGVVTDGAAAEITPIEGAQLSLFAADTLYTTTFTNAEGAYQLMGLRAGSYELMAEKDGYMASETIELLVTEGGNTVQDFALMPE